MQIPDDGRAFLTVKDLIAIGYGTRPTVYRELRDGVIPSIRVGKNRIIIPKDEFIAVLESRRFSPRAEAASEDVTTEAVM